MPQIVKKRNKSNGLPIIRTEPSSWTLISCSEPSHPLEVMDDICRVSFLELRHRNADELHLLPLQNPDPLFYPLHDPAGPLNLWRLKEEHVHYTASPWSSGSFRIKLPD